MPSPKWKLVVDVGDPERMPAVSSVASSETSIVDPNEAKNTKDNRIDEVVSLLGQYMPSDPSSQLATYLPGFMSLRLMLLRASRTNEEDELVRTMLSSFASYAGGGGRSKSDIAVMLARDFMFLTQQAQQSQQPFLGLGQSMMSLAPANDSQFHFGLPSSSSTTSFQDSPTLAPIPASCLLTDSLSIVSA